MTRRRLTVVAAFAAALLGISVPAWAYFSASATSAISAGAMSLTSVPAGTVTVTVTDANDATVSWTNPTNPIGTTYVVTANGQPFCSTTSNSCSHGGLTAGASYTFAVQPTIGTAWSTQATTAGASTPTLGLTLAPSNFTTLPATETGTLTGFPAASALSWHLDSVTGTSLFGSNTLPAGNAVSVTIPLGTSTGTHTVYVTSGSFTASTTVTYASPVKTLVITSTAVGGATSSTPNLGTITVQRQDGSGNQVTTGGSLTITLTSSSVGGSFGASQFAASSVTIPSGVSTATFYYGDTNVGTPTITASASGYAAATQQESITTAPAGLAITISGGTSVPPSCEPVSSNYSCNVTGVSKNGSATFTVGFVSASGTGVVYSTTQDSTVQETGQSTGSVTIAAGESESSMSLTASHTGAATKTSTLKFGPYTLTLNVST